MNNTQKIIAASTLVVVSLFLHMFHCDWLIDSSQTLSSTVNGGDAMTIMKFGSNSGILSRSRASVSYDALLGVAVPGLMIGTACYILATPKNHVD